MIICAAIKNKIYKINKETIISLLGLYNILTVAEWACLYYSTTGSATIYMIYNDVYKLRIPLC